MTQAACLVERRSNGSSFSNRSSHTVHKRGESVKVCSSASARARCLGLGFAFAFPAALGFTATLGFTRFSSKKTY